MSSASGAAFPGRATTRTDLPAIALRRVTIRDVLLMVLVPSALYLIITQLAKVSLAPSTIIASGEMAMIRCGAF
jgi:hypothetical protein